MAGLSFVLPWPRPPFRTGSRPVLICRWVAGNALPPPGEGRTSLSLPRWRLSAGLLFAPTTAPRIHRCAKPLWLAPDKDAASEADMRADEFLDQGIIDGQRLWMRIMQAIEGLQRERPRDGRRCIEQ